MIKIKLSILIFVGCFLHPIFLFAQLKTYQFEQIDSLQKIEKRTVVVFIHTDWCKYCQAMKNTTLKNKKIIDLLNTKFYFVNFDAEEKRVITFNRQKFSFKPTGNNTGVHQLAEKIGTVDGKVVYPTVCFFK